ncbi:cupin domain-containing protein [Rhizobium puerariae]|uniref:Cupin domain-containing protein n=1 Tax=Rhizobium puerariae TaxID=1585791 RepID=A0ABV6ABH2_9HYPH
MSKCQMFSFVENLSEVVPGGLYMGSVVGETMSVGAVNFRLPNGPSVPAKAHTHGEEASLQLRGGCTVNLGWSVTEPDASVEMEEGTVMIMPAEQAHSGVNRFDGEGSCLRLNVVTPPRAEYGAKGSAKVFYPVDNKENADA